MIFIYCSNVKVWEQYMKCDGLPDPVCVRELNTYLSLWKEDDTREDIDQVMRNCTINKVQ